ncbi:ubiquitin-conjugating enzyme/RWD-like protein [Phycomyces nitens]|nr:ubiquitin-conjugating enzyme/RWD-like protein [Phycomyces nitens]
MEAKYNLKNPAVKRIMQEAKELAVEGSFDYEAHPLEDNIFEWHFTVRGPSETEFENGRYHGRILLPSEYPFKPPELLFLTPNGRFELNTKICLSITGFHPEYWQPAWGIRTVILAVMGFFPTEARGAIGGLDYTKEERIVLAKSSKAWKCTVCQVANDEVLKDLAPGVPKPQRPLEDMPDFSLTFKPEEQPSETPKEPLTDNTFITQTPKELTQQTGADPESVTVAEDLAFENRVDEIVKETPIEEPRSSRCTTPQTLVPPTESELLVQQTNTPRQLPARHESNITSVRSARSPIWLDALIGILAVLLFSLIVRRYS